MTITATTKNNNYNININDVANIFRVYKKMPLAFSEIKVYMFVCICMYLFLCMDVYACISN